MLALDWSQNLFTLVLVIQILVTTLVIPLYTYRYVQKYFDSFLLSNQSQDDLISLKGFRIALYIYMGMAILIAVASTAIGYHAVSNDIELFNWNNQAGLVVLVMMAFIPFLYMITILRRFELVAKEFSSSVRSTSLKVTKWTEYFPKPLVSVLAIGHVLYIATIWHFMANPFSGFVGGYNFLALLFLALVFSLAIYVSLYREGGYAHLSQAQKEQRKQTIVRINLWCWIIAIYYISLSIWLQSMGDASENMKLVMQSFYFQVLLLLATGFFKLKMSRK